MKTIWCPMCFCAVLLVFGCEDQLGNQQGDDNTASTASGVENGADGHNSSSDTTNQNQSANSTTTANASTPSTQSDDPRGQPGQWADEELFTIIPPGYDPNAHESPTVDFCNLPHLSETLVLIRVKSLTKHVERCAQPPVANPYSLYEVERLLHLGGKKIPLHAELRRFGGESIHEGRDYILGIMEVDGVLYSASHAYEVYLYDPDKEDPRITFSGKRESLTSAAEAAFQDLESPCYDPKNAEAFTLTFFDTQGTRCR